MKLILSNKDKYFVYSKQYKCWMHRSPLKLIINPFLRFIQFWTDKPFVIYSHTEFDKNGKPHFLKYGFGRIKKYKVKYKGK